MSSYTDDLLSELKETVAADVAAEEARLKAELEARAAAEEEAARQAEAARRAEVEARLEAERHRRRLAVETRQAAVAEPAAQEEPVLPRHGPAVERLAPQAAAPAAAPQGRGAGFYFVVMGLPMLCITAIVIAWIFTSPPLDLNTQQGQVAGQLPTPPKPVIEVADPGVVADGAETPVKAELPPEGAVEDDGEEVEATAAKGEKKAGTGGKVKTTRTGPKSGDRRVTAPTPDKPVKPKKGGLQLDVGDLMGNMEDVKPAK